MKVGGNVHFMQIPYNFCGEKDGAGIYEGSKERKVNRNLFL